LAILVVAFGSSPSSHAQRHVARAHVGATVTLTHAGARFLAAIRLDAAEPGPIVHALRLLIDVNGDGAADYAVGVSDRRAVVRDLHRNIQTGAGNFRVDGRVLTFLIEPKQIDGAVAFAAKASLEADGVSAESAWARIG